jgi:rod shape-determining protein MreD
VISIIFFILLSFIFIILQSTILCPANRSFFYPDLNLILILFLAIFSGTRGNTIIAIGNGYMMDVLSGYTIGVHTLSRLSVFAIVRSTCERVYSQSRIVQAFTILSSTLFSWGFVWIIVRMKTDLDFGISLSGVVVQAIVNTLVGLPLFWMIKKLYARVQK